MALCVTGLGARGARADEVCTERFPLAALATELDQAERAFQELDEGGFDQSVHQAALVTRCLDRPLTPLLAARLHWVSGIQLYLQREPQRAAFALAAARTLEPTWTLSEDVLPRGHELWELYRKQSGTAELAIQPRPRAGELWFDGVETIERPIDRATVVQHVTDDDAIALTRYLLPGEGMPDYGANVGSPDLGGAAGAAPGPTRTRARLVQPWLAASAGAAAAGALGTFLIARQAEGDFKAEDPSATLDDLDRLRARTNRAGAASTGLSVAAVGLGVSAFFVGVW
jgi:hypothetical protein